MSVINKMLRDLDQHKVAAPGAATIGVQATGLPPRGVVTSVRTPVRWLGVGVLVLVLMAVALGVWLGTGLGHTPTVVVSAPEQVPMPRPAPLVALAPDTTPITTGNATSIAKLQTKPKVVASMTDVVPTAKRTLAAATTPNTTVLAPALPSAAQGDLSATMAKRVVSEPKKLLSTVALVNPAAAGSGQVADPAPAHAGRQALAQAQSLWREGAQLAAFDLLRGALAWSHTAATPPDLATLAAMAREHARMALVLGQGAESLVLLQQLEPRLSGVAEVWASRGQVAQRLGQHPEAARAYQQALALVPGQPRWMLGAAISLAVQGQLGLAADWAERARAMGGLTPEVRVYLAQLGVNVRAD